MQDQVFKADWSVSLLLTSAVFSLLLIWSSCYVIVRNLRGGDKFFVFIALIPVLILILSALYSVRGYRLLGKSLYVERLGWDSEIKLEALSSVELNPQAMASSIRMWGAGGLFSYTGWFSSPLIGVYQAYATNPQQAVVLRFPEKTIVVTPTHPELFVSSALDLASSKNLDNEYGL